jgi:hypothetical protein
MPKPTYEEVVEALRKLAGIDEATEFDPYLVCIACHGDEVGDSEPHSFAHEPGCPFAEARALLARIDAKPEPTCGGLKFEGPGRLEAFGRFEVGEIADDGEPACPPPDEPDCPFPWD